MKLTNLRKIIIIVCLLGIAVSLILLIPQVRQIIINLMELFLMGRELRDHAKWHQFLFSISIKGIILFGFLFIFCIILLQSQFLSYEIKFQMNETFQNKETTVIVDHIQGKQKLRKMKESYLFFVLLIFFYLLTAGIRIYWLTQKEGFHVDEGLSVVLACYNDYMWNINYEYNKKYTGKEIKEISLCDNDSIKNTFEDVFRLWKDNRDPPHTNLYYTFFRLSLAGLKTGDIKPIIFRGGILNLIFFTVSFIFFYLLMKLFFVNSRLLQISATACAFLSTAAISNTLFLRPYQIQETMFIIFCYYFFKTLNLKKYLIIEEKLNINTRLFFVLSIVTAFTLLTGYYSIIFIGLFGLYVVFIKSKKNNYHEIGYYIITLFFGFSFARLFYTRYFSGFFSYRASETKQTLLSNVYKNLISSIEIAGIELQRHFFTYSVIAVCVLCLILLIYSKKKIIIQTQEFFIFITSILYIIIVMVFAPFKTLRYVMPVFPFLVLLPAMMIYLIQQKKLYFLLVFLLCFAFLNDALNQNKIENLYRGKPVSNYYNRDIDVPVFVINTSMYKYADLVPYFNDEQVYYFVANLDDILPLEYNEFYLVVEDTLKLPDDNLAKYEIDQEFSVDNFNCKKLCIR